MNRNGSVFRLRNCVWFLAGWILLAASPARAAEVEMHACHYTPEVKQELKLTPEQEPQVEKVYSDLAPRLRQIQEAMQQRDRMRQEGTDPEAIQQQTQKVIALENECRERGHELLQPILTSEQYQKILEMEEVHRRRVRARRSGG